MPDWSEAGGDMPEPRDDDGADSGWDLPTDDLLQPPLQASSPHGKSINHVNSRARSHAIFAHASAEAGNAWVAGRAVGRCKEPRALVPTGQHPSADPQLTVGLHRV